jgi:hypothetical protein
MISDYVTSTLISGVQMGQTSKLDWLIGFVKIAIWVDSLYAVAFNFQNPSFMPDDPMTLLVGLLG